MTELISGYEEEGIGYLAVLVTTKDKAEALMIAEQVVSEKLCACANLIEPVTSVFLWKGNIEHAAECLMIIKTPSDLFRPLLDRIKQLHSYDVPEIIALPILAGNPSYLKWIDEVTGNLLMD